MSTNAKTVPISLRRVSGIEVNVRMVLDRRTDREQQKINTLTRYAREHPSGWKKRLELAELLYASGQWERAVEEYYAVIDRKPERVDLRLKLAKILQLLGKNSEAIDLYTSSLSLTDHPAARQHIRGTLALCRGDTRAALEAFRAATVLEAKNPAHWLVLGRLQREEGDFSDALQAFTMILTLTPDDLVALLESYDTSIALADFQRAGKLLERAREIAPDDFSVLLLLIEERCRFGFVSGEEGQKTRKMLRKVRKLASNLPEIEALLANYHFARGEREMGRRVLQQFCEQHPTNPDGWYYYSQYLLAEEKITEAIEAAALYRTLLYGASGERH